MIAALLPMAFVSGLMGPYMSPIPINAQHGHADLAGGRAHLHAVAVPQAAGAQRPRIRGREAETSAAARSCSSASLRPFLGAEATRAAAVTSSTGACSRAIAPAPSGWSSLKLVVLKMLPFDNKSEFQVIVNLPEGTTVETTARAAR